MKNIWNRKLPTLVGLFIITIGTVITTFLVGNQTIFQTRAGPGADPKNIKTTNVGDTAFTVSYITDDEVIGTISYGIDPNNLDSISLDQRDQLSQKINKYTSHSITVGNLSPNTTYYYSINSGDKKYLNNGSNYKIQTGESIAENPSSQIPISGKVVTPDGLAPKEGLVYVDIDGAQVLSALLKDDGTYTLPLNNLRDVSLSEYFKIDTDTIINIDIYAEKLFSSLSISPGEISPVPVITLSSSYDFSNPVNSPTPSNPNAGSGFPTFGNISTSSGEPTILTPDSEEVFSDPQPVFEGKAQPNETVEITIHSDENINTEIKADAKGNWKYTPEKELSPGEHTITITTKNKNGILKTITRSFTVFADGGQISRTPTLTVSPTSTPSPSPSTPTPTIIAKTTPVPTLPPTGNSSVIIASMVGFAAALSGMIVFFLTRGKSSL